MGWVRKFVFQTALAALLATTPVAAHAAIFDDGNDRHFVKDLRAKDPASLTDEEKAILAAANKVGLIGFCGGKNNGNAFLILYRGRPAVVTAAHFAFDPTKGRFLCSSEVAFVNGMVYVPNFTQYDSARPNHNRDFIFRKVELEFPPANWDRVNEKPFKPEADFLIFYLKEDITRDRMPDSSTRGYLRFAETQPGNGNLYMIGVPGDLGAGEMVYQNRCDGFMKGKRFYHGCDSLNGSSASLIGILENGEITFRGAHRGGHEIKDLPASARTDPMKANIATSSTEISALMKRESGRPDFLASDLQWLLTRASCYSARLDNQWGPSSRKALAAFAAAAETELPGTEPSPELLAAVEKVAPEGTKVCGR